MFTGQIGNEATPIQDVPLPNASTQGVTGKRISNTKVLKFAALIIAAAIVLGGVIILVINILPESQNELSVADLLELGEKNLLDLNYEQALVQFLAVIKVEPRNARAYIGAAEAYIGIGDTDSAIAILHKGLTVLLSNAEITAMLDELTISMERKPTEVEEATSPTLPATPEPVAPSPDLPVEVPTTDAVGALVTLSPDDISNLIVLLECLNDWNMGVYSFEHSDENAWYISPGDILQSTEINWIMYNAAQNQLYRTGIATYEDPDGYGYGYITVLIADYNTSIKGLFGKDHSEGFLQNFEINDGKFSLGYGSDDAYMYYFADYTVDEVYDLGNDYYAVISTATPLELVAWQHSIETCKLIVKRDPDAIYGFYVIAQKAGVTPP